jgi:hypothetical protein
MPGHSRGRPAPGDRHASKSQAALRILALSISVAEHRRRRLSTTPVLLLRAKAAGGYSMVADLTAYPWVLGVHQKESTATLMEELSEMMRRAEALAGRLQGKPGM